MKKKERIAALERRVAELEARPFGAVTPWWGVLPPPNYGVIYCSACGQTGNHICYGTRTISDSTNVTYIGATG